MLKDRFDQLLVCALAVVLVCTAVLLAGASPGPDAAAGASRQIEREIAYQARVAYLERSYAPVAALRDQGALAEALLKLEELQRKLPNEPHNDLLAGEILLRMGQFERAVESLAAAVRGNADYVDEASPLNRRELISAAVNEGLPLLRDRLRAHPDNATLARAVKDGYYLQGRLAGGCE
jgi:predicted Zn-dependent protease